MCGLWKEETCNGIGGYMCGFHDKNIHAMTLVHTYVVCEKNTHAMPLVDPCGLWKKQTCNDSGGSMCGLWKEHT